MNDIKIGDKFIFDYASQWSNSRGPIPKGLEALTKVEVEIHREISDGYEFRFLNFKEEIRRISQEIGWRNDGLWYIPYRNLEKYIKRIPYKKLLVKDLLSEI